MKKAFSLIELSIVILIIGILVAGVTQSSRLVEQMRISSAKAMTQSAPVNSIKDLGAWYDSVSDNALTNASGSKDVSDGDKITNWNDINSQSTTKYNTSTQGTGTLQPTYTTNAVNGLPALKFDGGDWLAFTNIQNQDSTTFAVVKTSTAGSTGQAYTGNCVLWSDFTGGAYDIVPMAIGGGFLKIFTGTPSESTLTGAVTVNNNAPHVLTSTRLMSTGALALYVDGTADGTATGSTGNLIANSGMVIGYQMDGYIAEIIVYTRVLKTEERKAVEAYLGKKWGVKVN